MTTANKKFICLGGGIGTANLIKGLSKHIQNLTVVVSTADDGGSSGRLRRLYNILPPGDLVSCMAAGVKNNNYLEKFLTYRFPGNRYGKDEYLGGHRIGNLIMVAMRDITGNFDDAVELFQKTFGIPGIYIPATSKHVSISAKTSEGQIINGEEKIDLGQYNGKRVLERVYLHPKNAKANPKAIEFLENADVIIAGPGDLYTTILPVLIIPSVSKILKRSKATKIFIINVANKPFETKGYNVFNYINAIKEHLGTFPFNKIIVNSNFSIEIPKKYNYSYVDYNSSAPYKNITMIKKDVIDREFPLYHCPDKLAKVIINNI